ncbi:MAG: TetR/AcrR family transcriptional regulator [Rhizobiaceae bacterium]|nr:TetR/AcrR family transcriptional regulator [Rhizobiaceae bacterium]
MNATEALKKLSDVSMEGLCGSILERHRETVRVQKPHIAISKLVLIIEATLKLSSRQSFHATSLRQISEESGVSMGSLYSYFDSKDTLLLMILDQVATTTTNILGNPPEEVLAKPLNHLRWLIETHVELTDAMLPWFNFAFLEAKSFPRFGRKAAIESEEASERIFREVIEKGVQQACFVVEDPAFAAALVKPLLQDWYVKRSKWRRRGINAKEYSTRVKNFVEKALSVNAAT